MRIIFWKKNEEKNRGKNPKNLLGVFPQIKIGLKKSSRKNISFLEKALFEETPPSSKKMGSKSEK